MSTFYQVVSTTFIGDIVEQTGWKLGDGDGNEVSLDDAVDKGYFNITDGENYVWVDTHADGQVTGFTRYGANNPDFFGNYTVAIDEYELEEVYHEYVGKLDPDENEFEYYEAQDNYDDYMKDYATDHACYHADALDED